MYASMYMTEGHIKTHAAHAKRMKSSEEPCRGSLSLVSILMIHNPNVRNLVTLHVKATTWCRSLRRYEHSRAEHSQIHMTGGRLHYKMVCNRGCFGRTSKDDKEGRCMPTVVSFLQSEILG